ncbi:hypothetical protein ACP3V3_02240 [Vibrio sp. PNB22_3_1]
MSRVSAVGVATTLAFDLASSPLVGQGKKQEPEHSELGNFDDFIMVSTASLGVGVLTPDGDYESPDEVDVMALSVSILREL